MKSKPFLEKLIEKIKCKLGIHHWVQEAVGSYKSLIYCWRCGKVKEK
jgi:hypothetical protein